MDSQDYILLRNSRKTDAHQAAHELDTKVDMLMAALRLAEGFISGFEGDESQDGIEGLLGEIRAVMGECHAV